MQSFTYRSLYICLATAVAFCTGTDCVNAQLISAIRTGRFEPAYRYSPSDPWIRTKATQIQTKHYGRFYNCDSEECKRNSPYIRWTDHHELDLPPKVSAAGRVAIEIGKIRQRVDDGSKACSAADGSGCNCQRCAAAQRLTR